MINSFNTNFSRPLLSVDEFLSFGQKKTEGQKEAVAELEAQKAENPTLTRKQAMSLLGISESSIISWGKRGLIRMIKLGHKCLYYQADIDQLLRNGTDSVRP